MNDYQVQIRLEQELDTIQIVCNLISKNCTTVIDSSLLYKSVLICLFDELKKISPEVKDIQNQEAIDNVEGHFLTLMGVILDQNNRLYPELISSLSNKIIFLPVIMTEEGLESAKNELNNFADKLLKSNFLTDTNL
jgi:hypothetical protein